MTNSYNPLLLLLIGVPLVGAIGMMFAKNLPVRTTKLIALLFSLVPLALAVLLWVNFKAHDYQPTPAVNPTPTATPVDSVVPLFSQVFSVDWIPAFGIRFSLGVDGISLVMIALIALLVPIVIGASWEEKLPAGRSVAGYLGLLLALESAMIGVFAATDVFLFYVMFEVMLIPMYFLIGAYGGARRTYAATKFFLYSLLGGLMMLASLIGLYVASADIRPEGGTLDWATLRSIADQIPVGTQIWIFFGFFIAFAIKAPLVPLHTWLPDAGAEAPVGAGTLLVGVLDKVGTFGFLRICLPLLPAASTKLAWLVLLLASIGIIYGAIVAAGQTNLKRFVTYTSIAHFGFIAMGCFVFTTQAVSGAVLYMVNHGLATGLLFLLVGMLAARGGSVNVKDYGGVWKVAPILTGLFLVASMATIAVPGTNSFISEFLVLLGSFRTQPVWAIIATCGIVLAAVYMLWIFQQVFTGPIRGRAVVATDPGDDHLAPAPSLGEVRTDPHGIPAVGPQPASTVTVTSTSVTTGVDPAARTVSLSTDVITEADPAARAEPVAAPGRRLRFGDLSKREIAVLSPLVVLIIFLGVYPKPVLDVINPTADRTVIDSGHTVGTGLDVTADRAQQEGK
ncbi:complex I subunit 4 family protein [Nakamurella aerolata]|uniref:NADH-quinone oxidoreductase subunit M n=1 Tax=Nakamurella aerolata TaxID=1656892 RepID=A0A849A4T9_9ACTN|nr:NADH-quinone oxidoreductase subunit M [Nakamurella aerolata]NNG35077.1 NADH-quinone oxidoreductase subunit M [Nakamurella aerolata]